jgi:hypothetical protein
MGELTKEEEKERNRLLKLQKISNRWFSKEEFERLQALSKKLFEGAGDPTEPKR